MSGERESLFVSRQKGAFVRSRGGVWHSIDTEAWDACFTDCGLILRDCLVDTAIPRMGLCRSCRWPREVVEFIGNTENHGDTQ